jgi:hypothetical protein
MERSTSASLETHAQEALTALRRMLWVVSAFAVAAVCVAVSHYFSYRAQLRELDQKIQSQDDEISTASRKVAGYCEELAIREFEIEKNADSSAKQLDLCMQDFPNDESLPAYKAQVYATAFSVDHTKVIDLEYALQAANLSNKLKPNMAAYEWQGLTYCLRAAFGPSNDRNAAVTSAIESFRYEFQLAPYRQSTISGFNQFQEFCSEEIKKSVLAPTASLSK